MPSGEITELPAHLPPWGRILWARYWRLSEQVDRQAATIARLKEIILSTQADVDALTTELAAATQRIVDEITALENANPALDLSALKTAVDALDAVVPVPVDPNA
jgi:uncharacterized coiled-coil protein SlyX